MAQSEALSVKDVVSSMLKCISGPIPLLSQDSFNHQRRATEINGGWENGGGGGREQPTDCSVIAGWGIMHTRLAKTARLWTYHTDNFLKLKEKMCHKDSKTPSLIITGSYGWRHVRDLDSLTVWFPQKQFWSQIVRSSQDRCSFNGQSPPPHALRSPERGLADWHGLRSLRQGNQRKTAHQNISNRQ